VIRIAGEPRVFDAGARAFRKSIPCTDNERRQSMMKLLGVALIVLGVIALVYQGITYTSKEKVIDIGPLKAEVNRERTIPLSPVLGVVALAGGIALLLFAGRRSS
jgi:uncharacterized membrane protein HdeD (DUF308 family)